jgi:hypothetical protein
VIRNSTTGEVLSIAEDPPVAWANGKSAALTRRTRDQSKNRPVERAPGNARRERSSRIAVMCCVCSGFGPRR